MFDADHCQIRCRWVFNINFSNVVCAYCLSLLYVQLLLFVSSFNEGQRVPSPAISLLRFATQSDAVQSTAAFNSIVSNARVSLQTQWFVSVHGENNFSSYLFLFRSFPSHTIFHVWLNLNDNLYCPIILTTGGYNLIATIISGSIAVRLQFLVDTLVVLVLPFTKQTTASKNLA